MTTPPIADAEWPTTPIPEPVKQLVNSFFTLVDSRRPDMGQRLSEDVFAEDSQFIANKTVYKGRSEIAKSRDGSWNGISTRRHVVTKVYTCNQSADDLLLIGFVNIGFNDGTKVDGSFVVRAIVDEADSQSPRLKLYQGWMDSVELAAAKKQQQ